MSVTLLDELKRAVAGADGRKLLIVCGAGVSAALTARKAPGWAQLLGAGVERVAGLDLSGDAKAWADSARAVLARADASAAELIAVADDVTTRLGGAGNREFADWIEQQVGRLTLADHALAEALLALDCPLATTNYDDLLCRVADAPAVCWSDAAGTLAVLNGRRTGVLHLHGHWRDPAHVVLGSKSYAALTGDARRGLIQQLAALDRPTLFVGCSPAGLTDPDFLRLGDWLTAHSGLAERRYWLLAEKDIVPPDTDRRLYPVCYGKAHGDLPAFVASLAPPRVTTLPPDPKMIGRADLCEQAVAALLAGRHVVIPGGPGMGKTALSLAAAYDARIVARYGARRVFVALDSVTSGDGTIRALAQALGVAAGAAQRDVLAAIAQRCAGAPVLALLDNAETPDQADPATREALARLAATPGLSLAISVRGAAHLLASAKVLDDLAPLASDEAAKLFRSWATQLRDDPDLPTLLAELEGHPLSLVLLGRAAEGEKRVAPVLGRWRKHKAALLREGTGDTRLTSVRASLRASLDSPQMTAEGRRLVGLLSLVPGGLRGEEAEVWIDDDAPALLKRLRLADERKAEGEVRLHMLAPLREAARLDCPATDADFAQLWAMIAGALAQSEACIRSQGGSHEAALREADNLDAVLGEANARGQDLPALAEAAQSLALFVGFLGRGSFAALSGIERRAEAQSAPREQARVISCRGDIALARSDHAAARAAYEEARPIYARIGDALGEANCIQSLGDIALARSDHAAARAAYEAARPIYARIGDALGEANCIQSLGDIALERSDHEGARAAYEEARTIYARIGDALGEANCIKSLGDIALRRSDHEGARAAYEAARPIYARIGDALGEANCIKSLGDIALARSDHEGARAAYEAARPIYARIGDALGEANCIARLGDIAEKEGRPDAARDVWAQALALYGRIPEPYSIGWTHFSLARVAPDAAARQAHRAAARAAWLSIDRGDLVAEHLDGEG